MAAALAPDGQPGVRIVGAGAAGQGPPRLQGIRPEGVDLHGDGLPGADHGLELLLGAGGDGLALIHNHDPAAQLLHLFHVVAGVDDGRALPVEPLDAFKNGVAALGIHRHGGFVQDDEAGLVGDAAGDVQPPEQTAAELLGQEAAVIAQAGEGDGLLDQRGALSFIRHIQAAEVVDVFLHGQLVEDRHVLHDNADVPLDVVGVGGHGLAEDFHPALVVFQQGQDAVDGGGLTRSVGAEKTEDFPFGDLQAEMIQRHQVAVSFDQIFHLNDHRAALRFYLPVYQGAGVRASEKDHNRT